MSGIITKEFLEKHLGQKVTKFDVTSGSNLGDGYTSTLFSIDVTTTENQKQTLILKCYPAQSVRHEFLQRSNVFHREISFYKIFIQELINCQKNLDQKPSEIIRPPFPEFVGGQTEDYSGFSESEPIPPCLDPLDHFIILPDLRKASGGGYHLSDRLVGFDLAHCQLIIAAQAQMHSLSWAYKKKHGLAFLAAKFPFLKGTYFDYMSQEECQMVLDNSLELFKSAIDESLKDSKEEELAKYKMAVERARKMALDVVALFFSDLNTKPSSPSLNKDSLLRVPVTHNEDEDPWLVAVHGDSKLSNMLFRYEEKDATTMTSGKEKRNPVEVKFIDLQFAREGDPMTDLAYTIYTATNSSFRKQNLDSLLKLYTLTFQNVCDQLQVDPPPGFQFEEVKRRFHRTKSFGFLMAFIGFPFFLCDFEDPNVTSWEEMGGEATVKDTTAAFKEMTESVRKSKRFQAQVMDVVQELFEEGVI